MISVDGGVDNVLGKCTLHKNCVFHKYFIKVNLPLGSVFHEVPPCAVVGGDRKRILY